ncbi:restriction endonuclease subunit S [Bacteroides caccae]|uniref:restriction endonuclease subunit S n=2 Tax=Bacteroidales TaxID=171549 RepID=UPI001F44CC8A|nr:restriction endonuclease subunit S [Bacteroides caccae]MCE9463117.1 restriction endonuclease subunit S [Bacteroides caccae]
MNGKQLKNSILQWAIQGKLVPQDPNDEPASVLLDKIRQEKERLIKEKKIKRDKNASIIYRGEDNSYYEKFIATGEVKCIDEEIPFEIPSSWEWCRMQDIMKFVNGRAYKKEELLSRGKYKVLRVGNFFTNNEWYYSDLELPDDKYCYPGDLLYAWSASFGPQIWNDVKTIFHYHIWNVKYNSRILLRDYLFYFFLYDKTQVLSSTTGSTMIHVSMENMKPRFIPIPPYCEQKRIVSKINELLPVIDKFDDVQKELDTLNALIKESLKKSILQEAIQGKLVPQITEEGTAQELLEQIRQEKLQLVKDGKLKKSALTDSIIFKGDDNKYYELIDGSPVCIDEFLPFQIPETWVWCKVKDLLEIQTGASFKKEQANANKKGIRILRGGNILPNKYIFKDNDIFVSDEFVNANTILKKNCIITPAVTSLENIGKMAVIEKDYNNVSAGGFVFIISPYIQAFYHSLLLAYFLQSPFLIETMRGITKKSGAAFYNLGKERLKELYLPLPPMAEQSRIVGKINEVLSSIMSR